MGRIRGTRGKREGEKERERERDITTLKYAHNYTNYTYLPVAIADSRRLRGVGRRLVGRRGSSRGRLRPRP